MDRIADSELLARARSGDRGAFGALIERHQPMVRRVAGGAVGHNETALELANESMLQAYLSLDRLRDDSRFQSWLYGIVLNVCKGHLRDQTRAPLSLEEVMGGVRFEAIPFAGIEPEPHEVAEARELHRLVLNAVNSLSPRNRAATLLFYYDQLSVREVAATLSISVAAVKGRLHTARASLREMLMHVYAGLDRSTQEERKKEKNMLKVKILDIVAQTREDKDTGASCGLHVVVMMDETGRRILPIWVGEAEGTAIAIGLSDAELPRPMTFTFMASLLEASGVEVEEVRVERLADDTFYAVTKVRNGEVVREVDARPSDAIARALHTGSPIYVAADVMETAGMDVPAGARDFRSRTKGSESVLRRFKERVSEGQQRAKQADPEERKETNEKARQELLAAIFGGESEDPGEAAGAK